MKTIQLVQWHSHCLKTIFFFLLLPLFADAFASDRIVYSYDESGNRVDAERIIVYTRGSNNNSRSAHARMYMDSLSLARITIYPNPTEGDLKIEITGVTDLTSSSLTICDMKGKVLHQIQELSESNELDITDYADGIYLLIIRIKEESTTWRIIKK